MADKIDKLNLHYSMTTPATIYDEEALTALQLAGRIAGKLNQVIELVNLYGEKVDNTYVKIQKITEDEVKMTLTTGLFDRVLEEYHRKLDAKINSIVASAGDGSIPSELALIRNTYDGQSYDLAYEAVNNQFKVFSENPLPDEMLYTLFDKTPNLFNPRNVSYNLALSDSEAILENPSEYYHTTGYIDLYPLPGTITDNTAIWFKQSMDGETVSMAQVRAVNFYDENYNHITTPAGRFEYVDYILVNDFPEYARYIRVTFDQNYLNAETNFGIGYTHEACLYKHYSAKTAGVKGWEGKTILAYGDSQVGQNKWQSYVENTLGCKIISYGLAGYPLFHTHNTNTTYALTATEHTSGLINSGILPDHIDAVLIVGGTNDIAQGIFDASAVVWEKVSTGMLNMENFKNNLMLEGYVDISTPFLFVEPFYTGENGSMASELNTYNSLLKEYGTKHGFYVIESGPLKQLNSLPAYKNNDTEFDGVHLTSTTAPIFANTVINALTHITKHV